VVAGDSGIMECAVACNALGSACSGFGLTGRKCFLMKSLNTNSSAADATMDALCMKNAADWLSLGTKNGEVDDSALTVEMCAIAAEGPAARHSHPQVLSYSGKLQVVLLRLYHL